MALWCVGRHGHHGRTRSFVLQGGVFVPRPTKPVPGEPAPDFSVAATGGQTVSLSALRGQRVVLYFYPQDNTSGCTREGLDFRRYYEDFCACNAVILGASRSDMPSHERFKARHDFPFDLLADEGEKLTRAFAVLNDRSMYGRKYRGVERSTFLIDEQGVLRTVWRKVRVDGHVLEVLAALQAL